MVYIYPLVLLVSLLSFNFFKSADNFTVSESGYIKNVDHFLQNPGQLSKLSFETSIDEGSIINCLVYLPEDYNQNPTKKYPLLIFLHGSSESGNDLEKVKKYGPPKLIAQGKSFPFIIISPQLPMKYASKWPSKLVNEVYEIGTKNFRVDKDRFYLTGVSVGGAGTWTYAVTYPDKVAAIAPICGWGNPSQACAMKDIPTWAFHGAKDKVISIEASQKMVNALKKCGAEPKFTVYPKAGHDSWTITYDNPTLYEWFLSQSKSLNTDLIKPKKQKTLEDDFRKKKEKSPQNSINLIPLTALPASIHESSGLVALNNSFWTHNDSGNHPVLFNIDSTGQILQIKRITNATNFDWEDITKDQKNNLYIGDFGNNKNNRRTLQIYKIPNPGDIIEERIKAEVIEFSFSDQEKFPHPAPHKNFDVEAMICFKDSLYLFSKNLSHPYTGYCKLYRLPSTPGFYTAELIDSVFLGNTIFEASITSGAISKDYKHLALLSYSKLFIFSCFNKDDFFEGEKHELIFPFLSQKEAIAFKGSEYIYITDEKFHGLGGNLYSAHLNDIFKSPCSLPPQ